ncbi:MAG: hypothetical protein AAF127_02505 [Pseudomonadota bacterium]
MGARLLTTAQKQLDRLLPDMGWGAPHAELCKRLASGGDERITLDPATGLNRYLSAPYPRDVLAYSSSTISDISPEAFAHLLDRSESLAARPFNAQLDDVRARIADALALDRGAARIAFAPSGTDLEYVALACVLGREEGGVHNILLGADETGSGCIHSAHGRYFARQTALGIATTKGDEVPGVGPVSLTDIPVRGATGAARSSAEIAEAMAHEIARAAKEGRHALVHCVHGSKTGLVLPSLAEIDALQARFGAAMTLVVDACQARITNEAIAAYLARGAIVLMTGSKFIGAPPFNGWALIPPVLADEARALPAGFANIFCRAQWSAGWAGREALPDLSNLSLTLRLNAALFELERFQALGMAQVEAQIEAFERAVESKLARPLGLARVTPGEARAGLIEMRTLITLDVSSLPGCARFEDAAVLHRRLALEHGVRLGQPVKCVRRSAESGHDEGGGWGGTLRIGLSMPQMSRWAATGATTLDRDMRRIAAAITQALDTAPVG